MLRIGFVSLGVGLLVLTACAGPPPALTVGPPAWAQGGLSAVPEPPTARPARATPIP